MGTNDVVHALPATTGLVVDGVMAANGTIVLGDNLAYLRQVPDGSVNLIYIDPPFNTGTKRSLTSLRTVRDASGDRVGFKGHRYRTVKLGTVAYDDHHDDFEAFLKPRLRAAYRVLRDDGALFVHLDPRESHYCKLWLDEIFGRDSFMNEIVWAYDFGGRGRRRWPSKHDNILWYVKDPANYVFNYDDIDRIPYLAPGLVGPEKAARGKVPTDTWWQTIVSPTGKEKTGYPTQKPLALAERIVKVHTRPDDLVMDFFAGSGTVGEAAARHGRRYVLVDNNPEAYATMSTRLSKHGPTMIDRSAQTVRGGRHRPAEVSDANKGLVHVIACTVSRYRHITKLAGPKYDAKIIAELLTAEPLGVFSKKQVQLLEDPTLDELREAFVDYASSRTAKGDVLVFYFSGHGCALGSTDFGFCTVDSRTAPDGGGFLPLTVLGFGHLMQTLAAVDVHPVMIVDACFSGRMGTTDRGRVTGAMQDNMQRHAGSSYGLLCSSYEEATSLDTPTGGAFTKALRAVAKAGIGDEKYRGRQFLTIGDLAGPVQQQLSIDGHPLSRLHVGPDLPEVPLVRNARFQLRTEKFGRELRDAVVYMWNGGKPREVPISDFADKVSKAAYGNHSKLSLDPWELATHGSSKKLRMLTPRGERFAQGKLKVPDLIFKDPETGTWSPHPDAQDIKLSDVP